MDENQIGSIIEFIIIKKQRYVKMEDYEKLCHEAYVSQYHYNDAVKYIEQLETRLKQAFSLIEAEKQMVNWKAEEKDWEDYFLVVCDAIAKWEELPPFIFRP